MSHTCHWPGCRIVVPPAMFMCKRHWFSLPKHLRDGIWATYRRGQEVTKSPSPAYLEAAEAVQTWIREYKISCGAWGRRSTEHIDKETGEIFNADRS